MHNNEYLKRREDEDRLARKITDLLRRELTEPELVTLTSSEVLWLTMQLLCGPGGAAGLIYSAVNKLK